MPQRLPVVRMFNLGLLEEIYTITYYWREGRVEIKAKARGQDCLLDLGLNESQKKILSSSLDAGINFVEIIASNFFAATNQLFDRVHVQNEKCTLWFPIKKLKE